MFNQLDICTHTFFLHPNCVQLVVVFSTGFVTRSNCPTPNNCDTDYSPSDCKSLEQGYFVVDEQECPGCQICIHKGWFIFTKGCNTYSNVRIFAFRTNIRIRFLNSRQTIENRPTLKNGLFGQSFNNIRHVCIFLPKEACP